MVDGITGMTALRDAAAPTPRRWLTVRGEDFAARVADAQSQTGAAESTSVTGEASAVADPPAVDNEVLPAASQAAAADQPAETEPKYTDWRRLFYSPCVAPPPPPPTTVMAPSAESLFGPNPWMESPTQRMPDGALLGFNPIYFATPETAAKVAAMLGGTVVERNAMTGDHSLIMQQQPNQMVLMPNGAVVNAGMAAHTFTHGYSQEYVDQIFEAWVNPTEV